MDLFKHDRRSMAFKTGGYLRGVEDVEGAAGLKGPNGHLSVFQALRADTNRHADGGVQEEAAAWRAAEETSRVSIGGVSISL